MANYRPAFYFLGTKSNPPLTLATGQRRSTLLTGAWDYEAQGPCMGCAGHAKTNPNGHTTIGRHFCNANSRYSPLHPAHRLPMRFIRYCQNYLSYQSWLVQGWQAADPTFMLNADAYNNFATWYGFEIKYSYDNTLVLACNGIDPREVQTFFAGSRGDDPNGPLTWVNGFGSWAQVGDEVEIGGNSVLAGRVRCRVTSFDFTMLPSMVKSGDGSVFAITVDQTVNFADLRADPATDTIPYVTIFREAYQPEAWMDTSEPSPMFVYYRSMVWDKANFPTNGIFELLDESGGPCRIAQPIADGELTPGLEGLGYRSAYNGTFKVEIDYGAGFVEIPLRYAVGNQWAWNRVGIGFDPSIRKWHSRVYLGGTLPNGQSINPLTEGAVRVRVYYGAETSDNTRADVSSPCQKRCYHCLEDFNGSIVTGSGVNGVGVYKDPETGQLFNDEARFRPSAFPGCTIPAHITAVTVATSTSGKHTTGTFYEILFQGRCSSARKQVYVGPADRGDAASVPGSAAAGAACRRSGNADRRQR